MTQIQMVERPTETLTVTGAVASTAVQVTAKAAQLLSLQLNITAEALTTRTMLSLDVPTSTFTTTAAHGFKNGQTITVAAATTMPDPLVALTSYYIIYVSTTTFQLAASYADALAGTAITMVDDGTGAVTFVPTALAGATWKPQWSNDNVNWIDLQVADNITVTGVKGYLKSTVEFEWFRILFAATSGQLTVEQILTLKGTYN